MIRLGHPAPDFTAQTTQGASFTLSAMRGRKVVLYFFPKAFTPGCTREAAQFQDAYAEVKALGAEVIGISTDDHQTQCDFAGKVKVAFPMIGDGDGKIAGLFDVFWPFFKLARRVTFLIDEAGVVRGVYQHELRIGQHADDVLMALQKLAKPKP
jgi:thioredoxin-dependent peroxiredoxin